MLVCAKVLVAGLFVCIRAAGEGGGRLPEKRPFLLARFHVSVLGYVFVSIVRLSPTC